MAYRYIYDGILVFRQDLQDFAWSAPMRDLAAKLDLSDVGLKKLLKGHGVITPKQGHWNKVLAGKAVPEVPKVQPRGPGETGRVVLDRRFANVLPTAAHLASSGPFESAAVPEDLDLLYEQELKAIGRVAALRKLERVHYGLAKIFEQEERRREKVAGSSWHWDAPKFDSAVDKRRLRILNAVFMALAKRDYGADAYERDGEIHASAKIGDTHLGLDVVVAGKHRATRVHGRERPSPDLPASTPLAFVIEGDLGGQARNRWEDDKSGTLETKIAQITAGIIVAGEARFRRWLKEAEEQAEQFRRWEEGRRQEETERRNQERLKHLRTSGELLRQATDLRALIASVRDAVKTGSVPVDQAAFAAWEQWASAEADRIDPVLSGQVLTHLAPDHEER